MVWRFMTWRFLALAILLTLGNLTMALVNLNTLSDALRVSAYQAGAIFLAWVELRRVSLEFKK